MIPDAEGTGTLIHHTAAHAGKLMLGLLTEESHLKRFDRITGQRCD